MRFAYFDFFADVVVLLVRTLSCLHDIFAISGPIYTKSKGIYLFEVIA